MTVNVFSGVETFVELFCDNVLTGETPHSAEFLLCFIAFHISSVYFSLSTNYMKREMSPSSLVLLKDYYLNIRPVAMVIS